MSSSQKDFFDKMASKYNSYAILVPEATQFRNKLLDKAMRKTLTPVMEGYREKFILEVGCGVGRWSSITSNKNSVVAVDISKSMVKIARESCKNRNCSFLLADASLLPFRNDLFDLVVSVTVLQHILSPKKFLAALTEITRCSKSEALIVEEMSSKKETLLEKVYCPIRIVPAKAYFEGLSKAGLEPYFISGLTFAPVAILMTNFLASRKNIVGGTIGSKIKASRAISFAIHFIMGMGTLSAAIMPRANYNPCLSLHTMVLAKKFRVVLQS